MLLINNYSLKKHFYFLKKEFFDAILLVLVLSFINAYFDYGHLPFFNIDDFLFDFFSYALFLLFFVFSVIIVLKFIALFFGYEAKFFSSYFGLVVGFLSSGLSYGFLTVFLPGGVDLVAIKEKHYGQHRLTFYRDIHLFLINLVPVLVSLFFSIILTASFLKFNILFFKNLLRIILLFAIYSFLPLPNIVFDLKGNIFGLRWWHFISKPCFGFEMLINAFGLYWFFLVLTIIASILFYFLSFPSFLFAFFTTIIIFIAWWFFKRILSD